MRYIPIRVMCQPDYSLLSEGLKAPENSLSRKLALELSDCGRALSEAEYLNVSLQEENARLTAENGFMIRLINDWKIKELG